MYMSLSKGTSTLQKVVEITNVKTVLIPLDALCNDQLLCINRDLIIGKQYLYFVCYYEPNIN